MACGVVERDEEVGEVPIALGREQRPADAKGLEIQPIRSPHATRGTSQIRECSKWTSNDRTLQSPLSTVCGQYCVAFLMFRCRNVSMHAFTRLFTTDLVANDCRVFDWLAAVNTK